MSEQDSGNDHAVERLIAERATALQGVMVISRDRNCYIEIFHVRSDACVWTVRRWKKVLFFKKLVSSDWFINEQQALTYAAAMKKEFFRQHKEREAAERQYHARAI